MFIAPHARPQAGLRPADSGIAPGDWDVLSRYWYPLVEADALGDKPVAARLLDVDLVVFRSAQGISVARDRCPHRHIRLSAGEVRDGEIVCPYHALAFDGSGQCTRIPALGRQARIPAAYRLDMFPVREKYGLIWTSLSGGADAQIPTFPDIPDDGTGICYIKTRDWPCSAARQIENFFDLAHLPVVHHATLGNDETMPVSPGRVIQHDDGIALHADYVERPFQGAPRACTYTYRVILPFTIDFTVLDETGHAMKLYDVVAPTSGHACRVFQFMKDTRDIDENHRQLIEGLDAVNIEDIEVLQHLALPDLPLNTHFEVHLPVDNVSYAYRERLVALGLGASEA
ncbi:MAG: aromatic ring-hydroxylating dioxygenase subunit alpha [Novosphingobium sp.]|nr:aromatic ring-hydroxylating dioxygenase subunit alpha [Novosphingobium sp.]